MTCQSHATQELLSELNSLNDDLLDFWNSCTKNNPSRPRALRRLMEYVQKYGTAKSHRDNPQASPNSSLGRMSGLAVSSVNGCTGRSPGLFGERLAQFERGMKSLNLGVESPEGLDVYPPQHSP